jgi:fructokinase
VASLCGIHPARTPATLKALARQYGLRLVALTCGPRGAILVAGDEESVEPATAVRVVDTVGAGDAFTAALVCDFLRGVSLCEANRRANAVAAFVCSLSGATAPFPRVLLFAGREES